MFRKRVSAECVERILFALIAIFAAVTIYVVYRSISLENPSPFVVIILLFLILIMTILGMTHALVKVWDQHNKHINYHTTRKK